MSAFSRARFDHRFQFQAGPRVGFEQPGWSSPRWSDNSPTLGAVHDDELRSGVADITDEAGKDTSGSGHSASEQCPTSAVLVQSMVDTQTLIEHLIDLDGITECRHQGRYLALCDVEILAASMHTEERGFCRECLRRQVDRCT